MAYNRTLDELKSKASLHWTEELVTAANKETLLFDLLATQDEFIAVLKVASKSPLSWRVVLDESENLTLPLFTKHLMILCDLGGETLNKILPIEKYFPDLGINLSWQGKGFTYKFKAIQDSKSLTNSALNLSKNHIKKNNRGPLLEDLVMILFFGGLAENGFLPEQYLVNTQIGSMLGDVETLDSYIQQNYIRVSTQIKGAHSNALGHFAQNYVANLLKENLSDAWKVKLEGSLTGVKHSDEEGAESNFDITAVSPNGVQFAIEVSFQVTTNSVIERKARDSAAIQQRANALKHFICYVIDGAGNINVRKHAVKTILSHSDCTVALTGPEIGVLSDFLKLNG
jgi:hypothetical protein